MNSELSARVEALYASGRVERPRELESSSRMHYDQQYDCWVWMQQIGDWWHAQAAEAVIAWSLVQACWAKGWHVWREGQYHVCEDSMGECRTVASGPTPIEAMVTALEAA